MGKKVFMVAAKTTAIKKYFPTNFKNRRYSSKMVLTFPMKVGGRLLFPKLNLCLCFSSTTSSCFNKSNLLKIFTIKPPIIPKVKAAISRSTANSDPNVPAVRMNKFGFIKGEEIIKAIKGGKGIPIKSRAATNGIKERSPNGDRMPINAAIKIELLLWALKYFTILCLGKI